MRRLYTVRHLWAPAMTTTPPNNIVTVTVPTGKRAVIRTLAVGKNTSPSATCYLFVGPAPTPYLIDSIALPTVAIYGDHREYNDIVCDPGWLIRVQCQAGAVNALVGGFLLDEP